jgi:endonuclease YncB( thermonuclease family)
LINKFKRILSALALASLVLVPSLFLQAYAETLFKVKDGDSFYLGADEIRIWGIDAPEFFQKCTDKNGAEYSCGRKSKDFLQSLLATGDISCKPMPRARRETRTVAKCFIDGQDIAEIILRQGMAVEYDYFSKNFYDEFEQAAKNSKLGIWSGTFTNPRDWRKKPRKYR